MNKTFKVWLIAILFCLFFSILTLQVLQIWLSNNPYARQATIVFVTMHLISALCAYLFAGCYILNKKIFIKWVFIKIILIMLLIAYMQFVYQGLFEVFIADDILGLNEWQKPSCSNNYIFMSFEKSNLICSISVFKYYFFQHLNIWFPLLLFVEIAGLIDNKLTRKSKLEKIINI
jgi:hypothetical protein